MSGLVYNAMDKGITLSVLGYWGTNLDTVTQKVTETAGCITSTINGCVSGLTSSITSSPVGSSLVGFGPPQLSHISYIEPSSIWLDPGVTSAAASGDLTTALAGTIAALTAGTALRGVAKKDG